MKVWTLKTNADRSNRFDIPATYTTNKSEEVLEILGNAATGSHVMVKISEMSEAEFRSIPARNTTPLEHLGINPAPPGMKLSRVEYMDGKPINCYIEDK